MGYLRLDREGACLLASMLWKERQLTTEDMVRLPTQALCLSFLPYVLSAFLPAVWFLQLQNKSKRLNRSILNARQACRCHCKNKTDRQLALFILSPLQKKKSRAISRCNVRGGREECPYHWPTYLPCFLSPRKQKNSFTALCIWYMFLERLKTCRDEIGFQKKMKK